MSKKKKISLGSHGTLLQEIPLKDLWRFANHDRIKVFLAKGTRCAMPGCDHVGTRLIKRLQNKGNQTHWDVYTDNLIMMTVDHIIPLSRDGEDTLENKQPMCEPHNRKKGNKLIL